MAYITSLEAVQVAILPKKTAYLLPEVVAGLYTPRAVLAASPESALRAASSAGKFEAAAAAVSLQVWPFPFFLLRHVEPAVVAAAIVI